MPPIIRFQGLPSGLLVSLGVPGDPLRGPWGLLGSPGRTWAFPGTPWEAPGNLWVVARCPRSLPGPRWPQEAPGALDEYGGDYVG